TAEDCSSHVFLSYSYFSRSFKRITGHTFKDYLNITRINQAEKALVSTRKPITEIAAECGLTTSPTSAPSIKN
ncbi:MAG: helix-turn-helix transcriptional regulator, partial [Clostridia bacterium]|nr:helix-turn-helix transcriptional regulator [Clostridia bacterium]